MTDESQQSSQLDYSKLPGLRVGLIGEALHTVSMDDTARTMGSGGLDVYSTPAMIALMEAAAVAAVDPQLPITRASVGIEINVRHLAATPIGERVHAVAEVVELDGRRVVMAVRAWDEHDLIGEAEHVRYVIDIDRFLERLSR